MSMGENKWTFDCVSGLDVIGKGAVGLEVYIFGISWVLLC